MSSQNWSGRKGSQSITILDTKVIVRDVGEQMVTFVELQKVLASNALFHLSL